MTHSMTGKTNDESDQPAICSQFRVFAVHSKTCHDTKNLHAFSDVRLLWSQMSFCLFCHAVALHFACWVILIC